MGLFGLFYTVFALGVKGTKSIKAANINKKRRNESITSNKQTYIDSDGCERLTYNNQKVLQTYIYTKTPYCEYKDYVLKQVDSNNIIKNYSAEKRNQEENERYNDAIKNGKTVYRLGTLRDNYYHSRINGYRYKDINTNAIYVIRSLNGVKFYMDIDTGQFIRETDGEVIRNKTEGAYHHDEKEYEILRQKINTQQKKYLEQYGYIDPRNSHCNGGTDWYEA